MREGRCRYGKACQSNCDSKNFGHLQSRNLPNHTARCDDPAIWPYTATTTAESAELFLFEALECCGPATGAMNALEVVVRKIGFHQRDGRLDRLFIRRYWFAADPFR